MADYADQTFSGVDVEMDGNTYLRCRFEHCALIYRGDALPSFDQCSFHNSRFRHEDAAGRTLAWLRWLIDNGNPQLVSDLLRGGQGRNPLN